MATLEHLVAAGKLKKHDPDLDDDELPTRIALFTPEFDTWLVTTLVNAPKDRNRNLRPFEQAEQILFDFAIGRPMAYGLHYRKLDPLAQHVWELKTEDVRLFGWFPQRAHFIAVCGSLKNAIRKARDYAPFIQKVIDFRTALELDEPKAITGVGHDDVL